MKQKAATTLDRQEIYVRKRQNQPGKKVHSHSRQEQADIEFMMRHLNSPVNVFDHAQKKFIYVNDKFSQLVGLSASDCYAQELKDFDSWIHPCDLSMLQNEIGERLEKVYQEYVNDHSNQLHYLVNFRLKEKDKSGIHTTVLSQCSVMEWDENHTPAITMNILSDISHYNNSRKMILIVNLFDDHLHEWKPVLREEFLNTPVMLTRREKQITEHIIRDKSATTISRELNIPFHTVRAHWRNILQKTNCKTQKDLKQLAHAEGWL